MAEPLISVIIPVGPGHRHLVGQAVASALRSSVRSIEVIVVNDSGGRIRSSDPRVRVVAAPRGPGLRPAVARNAGLAAARGVFVVHLDADDWLLPDGLSILLRGFAAGRRAYVYSAMYGAYADGSPIRSNGQPVINDMLIAYDEWDYTRANLHPITSLAPLAIWRDVGGFDAGALAWDDWTGYARLRRAGHCGEALRQPTFVYRIGAGLQHTRDNRLGADGMAATRARIVGEGWRPMPCGCGQQVTQARAVAHTAVAAGGAPPARRTSMTRILEYIGPGVGTQTIRIGTRAYRVGRNSAYRYLSTDHTLIEDDIPELLALGVFVEVPPPPAYAPPPSPEGVVVEDSAPARRRRKSEGAEHDESDNAAA